MSKLVNKFLSKIFSNFNKKPNDKGDSKNTFNPFALIKTKIAKIVSNGIIGTTINNMISMHITMYHEAYQAANNPAKPDLKDLLPPPTPKQIIRNMEAFIKNQNECFGHASDEKNVVKVFERMTIEELNEFHEKLSGLNKSFFDDHDYSAWKVEQNACNEALDMQKELDARGFIEIVSDEKNKDESND